MVKEWKCFESKERLYKVFKKIEQSPIKYTRIYGDFYAYLILSGYRDEFEPRYAEEYSAEVWKQSSIDDFEVSSYGRVRNKNSSEVLDPSIGSNGYYYVGHRDSKGKRKVLLVHRLIAEAFRDNPKGYRIVDHIDGDKTNNFFENLRWCSSSDNRRNPITYIKTCKLLGSRPAIEVARENGIDSKTVRCRVHSGWSLAKACTVPKKGVRK